MAAASASKLDESVANSITAAINAVRGGLDSGKTLSYTWRLNQLKALRRLVTEREAELTAAHQADLCVNKFVTSAVEQGSIILEVDHAIDSLAEWMKPEAVSSPLLSQPAKSYVQSEPKGVALIVAPWNYPLSLVFNPLAAAIAAGCTAVVKPSEVSSACSAVVAKLIPLYLDQDAVRVVEGAVAETQFLLQQRWDIIFYTGGPMVGKLIMRAAAEYLTPTILELGGKCPVIVANDANIEVAAKRIVWAKFSLNMGQTCLAPDYVLATSAIKEKLLKAMVRNITEFYGENPKDSGDVSRIINQNHTRRIAALLDDPSIRVVAGGQVDVTTKYIAPTIVEATPTSKVMEDEIFGPVLPVLTVNGVDDAIQYVRSRDKPLGLYVFSQNTDIQNKVLHNTSSGGACVNDIAMHYTNGNLPFGGIGTSGMGAYHGKYGFDAFSHKKAVFVKYGADPFIKYPPYTDGRVKLLNMLRNLQSAKMSPVVTALVFAAIAVAIVRFLNH